MKLLWTWVQSAKWPLKMTRRQANRRLCKEQWPRQKVQGQKGEGVLWTKRTLEWRIQPTELRRSAQRNSFPKATRRAQVNQTQGRQKAHGLPGVVGSLGPALFHAHVHLLLCLHGTKRNPDMTTLSPGLGGPEQFFSSWLFIPEVSAGPILGAQSLLQN